MEMGYANQNISVIRTKGIAINFASVLYSTRHNPGSTQVLNRWSRSHRFRRDIHR